ncbi:hypothetical protein M3Y95_00212300 [Aphelenchoides besseyi]|nr:hypothetical protein M3Y95_00212300 [Aphelenchoides besseyi]
MVMTRTTNSSNSLSSLFVKIAVRITPLMFITGLALHFEWKMWKSEVHRRLVLDIPTGVCSPDDVVCHHCPFFRETIGKMSKCLRKEMDNRKLSLDVGILMDSIPSAVSKCNLNWMKEQPLLQLIHEAGTQLVVIPNKIHLSMNVLVIGNDINYEVEKQLFETVTNAHFYGANILDTNAVNTFKRKLNGTLLNSDDTLMVNMKNAHIIDVVNEHFSRKPVDLIFIHTTDYNRTFVDQLMGRNEFGLLYPTCQININIPLPIDLKKARELFDWFGQLSTTTRPLWQQYVVGFATTILYDSQMHLRFFAINVGQPYCVAKFLDRSECRPLIGTMYDEWH